jgi:hypothetical protein
MYLWQYQHMNKLAMINHVNGLIFEDKEAIKTTIQNWSAF